MFIHRQQNVLRVFFLRYTVPAGVVATESNNGVDTIVVNVGPPGYGTGPWQVTISGVCD